MNAQTLIALVAMMVCMIMFFGTQQTSAQYYPSEMVGGASSVMNGGIVGLMVFCLLALLAFIF